MTDQERGLLDLLCPNQTTQIVDIGANPVDGEPPYARMVKTRLAEVTGFEPQPDAFAQLKESENAHRRYLPYAIGDGKEHVLQVCKGSGMTSLLEPDKTVLDHFHILGPLAEVVERIPLKTKRLDDIKEITHVDLLKIDVQGFELTVFQNGRQKLSSAVAIQTEVSFTCLYEKQPSFGQVDEELRKQGFIPHCFTAVKQWAIAPMIINNDPRVPLNHLLEADIVYVRDFMHPDMLDDEQLKQLCLISHVMYASYDLASRCVLLLERRGTLKEGSQEEYFRLLAT